MTVSATRLGESHFGRPAADRAGCVTLRLTGDDREKTLCNTIYMVAEQGWVIKQPLRGSDALTIQ